MTARSRNSSLPIGGQGGGWSENALLAVPFFIKADVTKARIIEPEKISEIGLFRLDNVPQPLHTCSRRSSHSTKYFDRYR